MSYRHPSESQGVLHAWDHKQGILKSFNGVPRAELPPLFFYRVIASLGPLPSLPVPSILQMVPTGGRAAHATQRWLFCTLARSLPILAPTAVVTGGRPHPVPASWPVAAPPVPALRAKIHTCNGGGCCRMPRVLALEPKWLRMCVRACFFACVVFLLVLFHLVL